MGIRSHFCLFHFGSIALREVTVSTYVSPCLDIYSVLVAEANDRTMLIPISLSCKQDGWNVDSKALVDSAAGGIFIDQNYAWKERIPTKELPQEIIVRNVDGTPNKMGTIRRYVDATATINGRKELLRFYVTGLGRQNIILGMPWLRSSNPMIN